MDCEFKGQSPFMKEKRKDPFTEVRQNHVERFGGYAHTSCHTGWPQIVALVGKAYGFGANRLYSETLASDDERGVAAEFANKLSVLYLEYRMKFYKAYYRKEVKRNDIRRTC